MKRTIPCVTIMNFLSPSLHYSINTVTTTNSSFRLNMLFQLYFDHDPKINFFFIIHILCSVKPRHHWNCSLHFRHPSSRRHLNSFCQEYFEIFSCKTFWVRPITYIQRGLKLVRKVQGFLFPLEFFPPSRWHLRVL